jgi:hypothetical protein
MQATLNVLYKTIKTKKKKERFETILEPLQAILQIAYLSFTPIGTKLTIHNNILYIQPPNYSQSIVRWYNNDTQEDLFYLFNIFYRFKKFYYFLCGRDGGNGGNDVASVAVKDCEHLANASASSNIVNKKLYDLLIELAKNGIGNLIRTYGQTEKIHILHTLQMYKNILETDTEMTKQNQRPDIYNHNHDVDNLIVSHASHASHDTQRDKSNKKKGKSSHQHQMQQVLRDDDNEEDHEHTHDPDTSSQKSNSKPSASDAVSTKKIDDVFIRITDMYSQEIYYIIYNTLILMYQNDTAYQTLIDGLNKILEPTNIKIKKWIDENIVF